LIEFLRELSLLFWALAALAAWVAFAKHPTAANLRRALGQ